MNFNEFLTDNSSAVIGLAGVIIGALISGIVGLISQSIQRRWNIDAQRREWMRQRRERQLDELLAWLNQWLRTAARVRRLEEIVLESKIPRKKLAKMDVTQFDAKLESYGELLRDLTVTSQPIIMSVNDRILSESYDEFMNLIAGYQDAFTSKNFPKTVESNRAILLGAKELISRMQLRADEIIEGIYRNK